MKFYYMESNNPVFLVELSSGSIAFASIDEWVDEEDNQESLEIYIQSLLDVTSKEGLEDNPHWTFPDYFEAYPQDKEVFIGEANTVPELIKLARTYMLLE